MGKLFLPASAALVLSIIFSYFPNSSNFLIYKIVAGLAFVTIVTLLLGKHEGVLSLAIVVLFSLFSALVPFAAVIGVHLVLVLIALHFIGRELKRTLLDKLKMKGILSTLTHGIGLFVLMGFLLIVSGLIMLKLGITPDSANVSAKVATLPWYILLFAILIAPLSEELFFRGFLSPRIGAILAAILFALSHFTYGSYYEIFGAFLIGLVLSFYYLKEKNLASCMIAHGLFNLMSLGLMVAARQML